MNNESKSFTELACERMTFPELAQEYEQMHGQPVTSEALRYRVRRKGMTKYEAVMEPLCTRGRSSERKRLTVGRRIRNQKCSGLTYVYLHLDCPGADCQPKVRYVGKGESGRAFDFNNRCDEHQEWIKSWFTAGNYQYWQFGLNPAKLRDLSWLNLKTRKQAILVSHPFKTAQQEEKRLIHFYNLAGQPLFNRVLYSCESGRRPNHYFQSRLSRKKAL